MVADTSNPNIEWKKKKGFENKERLSLRIDVKKALKQEAEDKKNVLKNNVSRPSDLPKGLKKIRSKIKDIYDEDDEDENDYIISPLDLNNSLLNALQEDEKRQLQQQKTIQTMDNLQNAGKAASIVAADKISKDLGLKGLDKKTINKNMMDVSSTDKTYENTLKDELTAKAKIKGRNFSEKETVNLLRGIKKIQTMAEAADTSKLHAIEGWKIEELVDAGQKSSDEKIAEKILEKTGRKKDKDSVQKITKKAQTKNKTSEKEQLQKTDFQR